MLSQPWPELNPVCKYTLTHNIPYNKVGYKNMEAEFKTLTNNLYPLTINDTADSGICAALTHCVFFRLSDNFISDAIVSAMASHITGVSIVCSTICSGQGQRKQQSSASQAFVREINRWRRKCFHLMTSSCLMVRRLCKLLKHLWI